MRPGTTCRFLSVVATLLLIPAIGAPAAVRHAAGARAAKAPLAVRKLSAQRVRKYVRVAAVPDLGGFSLARSGDRPPGDAAEADAVSWTPLMTAAGKGDVAAIRRLARDGADLADESGPWTPLTLAISNHHPGAVAELLRVGADPNHRDAGGITPLMLAAEVGSAESVKLLLARGAEPAVRTAEGYTALKAARANGRAEVFALLRRAGAVE